MARELTSIGRTIIDRAIEAMRRKQIAFSRLHRLAQQHQEQEEECMRLRDDEQDWIDRVLFLGLEEEWQQRVRKEFP